MEIWIKMKRWQIDTIMTLNFVKDAFVKIMSLKFQCQKGDSKWYINF